MKIKYVWIALGSLLLLVLAAYLVTRKQPTEAGFEGSVIDPPAPVGDFSLVNQEEQVTTLHDLQGKYLLIFFGFTNCTNECPAAMAILSQVRRDLSDLAEQVQIVLISTDPARDTPEAMMTFVNRFDATSVGLTGSLAELQPIWDEYGVMVLDNGETHSTRVYLVDPQGNLRLTYSSPTTPDGITADLRMLIQGQ